MVKNLLTVVGSVAAVLASGQYIGDEIPKRCARGMNTGTFPSRGEPRLPTIQCCQLSIDVSSHESRVVGPRAPSTPVTRVDARGNPFRQEATSKDKFTLSTSRRWSSLTTVSVTSARRGTIRGPVALDEAEGS